MLAALYDVHGNAPALDAVLADARAAGARKWVLGGDFALMGPWPVETLGRLRELEGARWLRGNADRWLADSSDAPDTELMRGALSFCRESLGDDAVRQLVGLPAEVALDQGRFCHASPVSDMRSFAPEPDEDEDELLAGVGEGRLVFGHTHLQFTRTSASGVELVNPGSVGLPFDGDVRAAYALVHDDGRVELRRVSYDNEASATAALDRMGPWADLLARRLRTARVEPA
jgi:diadenosine tetraphosphatase ApaH/serine/threonine PP2A family protein phosphatase